MNQLHSAIVTVAYGHSTERLDHTFTSFAINANVPLHAFVIGDHLPHRRIEGITYHLVQPDPSFLHPLREVYFRRLELIDELDVDIALVVDSYDVLCLQRLLPFDQILGAADFAACVEHMGSRYVAGQGYTANFLNGGVFFWQIPRSQDVRREIVARGKCHFRTVADDQFCINEVIQTKHYERLRILPCQYNYRAYFGRRQRGWPTVSHLDGVLIYHNAACMDDTKRLLPVRNRADLPALPIDKHQPSSRELFFRRLKLRLQPWVIR